MKTKLLKKIRKEYCITKETKEGSNEFVAGYILNRTNIVILTANRERIIERFLPSLIYRLYKNNKQLSYFDISNAHQILFSCYEYIKVDKKYEIVFLYKEFEKEVMSRFYDSILQDFKKHELKKYKVLLYNRKIKALIVGIKKDYTYKKELSESKKRTKANVEENIKNNKFRW